MIVCVTVTRLSPEEKAFAEKNIGILFAFMRRYHLPEDYFGALAIAYVRFVGKYFSEKEKYCYSFSTLVWQRLRSELSHILRRESSAQMTTIESKAIAGGSQVFCLIRVNRTRFLTYSKKIPREGLPLPGDGMNIKELPRCIFLSQALMRSQRFQYSCQR